MVTGKRIFVRLTQKQLAHNSCGYAASRIMHSAITSGCKITLTKRGRKQVDLCEYILKTNSAEAIKIANKLRIKLEIE